MTATSPAQGDSATAKGLARGSGMMPSSIACARGMRDAGIDAMAALDSILPELLSGLPEHEARELKHTFGAVMAEVVDQLINPAVRAFPELQTDAAAWAAVAKQRAMARVASS